MKNVLEFYFISFVEVNSTEDARNNLKINGGWRLGRSIIGILQLQANKCLVSSGYLMMSWR